MDVRSDRKVFTSVHETPPFLLLCFFRKICWLPGLPDPSHHHVLSNLKNDNSEEEPMGFEEFFQELSRELTRTPFNPSTEKGAEFEGKERSPPPGAVKRVLESVSDSQLKESDPFESLIPSVVGFVFNLESKSINGGKTPG